MKLKTAMRGLLVILMFMISAGHAVESEEDLPGWKSYKASPDLFESYVHYQRVYLHQNLRTMDMSLSARENHIFHGLAHKRGPVPQRARLIWWVQEPDPTLRKELLLQWLSEKAEIPAKRDTKTKLRRLLPDRKPESVEQRIREVDEVYTRLLERHRKVQTNAIALQHCIETYPDAPILEKMTEEAFFSEDASVRLRVYQEVYPALRKRRWPESPEVETVNGRILQALYFRESEAANLRHLRTEFIAEYHRVEQALEFDDAQAAARETVAEVKEKEIISHLPVVLLQREYSPEAWEWRSEIGLLEEVRARLEAFVNTPGLYQREAEKILAEREAAWKKYQAEQETRQKK